MFKRHIREGKELFRHSKPGFRFKERYYRRHAERNGKRSWGSILNIVLGWTIMIAGVIMLAIPGPGLLAIFIGAGIMAGEFLIIARFSDWLEVKIRNALIILNNTWRRTSIPFRVLLGVLVLSIAVGVGYGAYRFVDVIVGLR